MQRESFHLNERALTLVQEIIRDSQSLGVELSTLPGGCRVLDCGINQGGSLAAGVLVARICLGGLGQVDLAQYNWNNFWLPGVQVSVQHPVIACIGSQYAGWAVKGEDFFAMGSGPARALAAREEVYELIGYQEKASQGVLVLETRTLPPDRVACRVAEACGLKPEDLWLLVAPTASLVGSVQVASRVVETGLHKLMELGYDLERVTAAYGTCPLAPVAGDDLKALGRTNDAVLFGGRCFFTLHDPCGEINGILDQIPASASRDYSTPFFQLFQQYGDFYKIDPFLFSPAEVIINNTATGEVLQAGSIQPSLLEESLLGGG